MTLGERTSPQPDRHHTRLVRTATSVAALIVAAKLIAVFKEIAVAERFGTDQVVDAYQLAYSLVTWLPLIVVSAINLAIVPRLIHYSNDSVGCSKFISEFNARVLVIGIVFTLLTVLVAPSLINTFGSRLSDATTALAVQMVFVMCPLVLLTVGTGALVARLMASQQHFYTFLEALPSAGILALLAVPIVAHTLVLPIGTVFGALLQTAWLAALVMMLPQRLGTLGSLGTNEAWERVYRGILVMIVGQIAMSLITPIDQFSAAQLGDGAIALLGYGNRIIALFSGIGAVAISRAALPMLAQMLASGSSKEAERSAVLWSFAMFVVGAAFVAICWPFAEFAVRVLYERGEFGASESSAVAGVLRLGLLQLPFYFAGMVLVQYLAAANRQIEIGVVAIVNLLTKVVGNLTLPSVLGVGGIALATSAMYAIAFASYSLIVWRAHGR